MSLELRWLGEGMLLLGLDFETTGLEYTKDRVIEVGAVVWDGESQKPMAVLSDLILPCPFSGLSQEVIDVTGITEAHLEKFGKDGNGVFENLVQLMKHVDYVVAHNAEFDHGFYIAELFNLGVEDEYKKPWIDTLYDIPYPSNMVTRKLTYLAAEHRFVNPFAHRALFDAMTMMEVLSNYSLEDVIRRSKSPQVDIISHVSFAEKDKAKNLGFRWDGESKKWIKRLKQCDMESCDFPFEVTVVELEAPSFEMNG